MQRINNSETLGRLIRAERKNQKLTQQELSALAGVGVRFGAWQGKLSPWVGAAGHAHAWSLLEHLNQREQTS